MRYCQSDASSTLTRENYANASRYAIGKLTKEHSLKGKHNWKLAVTIHESQSTTRAGQATHLHRSKSLSLAKLTTRCLCMSVTSNVVIHLMACERAASSLESSTRFRVFDRSPCSPFVLKKCIGKDVWKAHWRLAIADVFSMIHPSIYTTLL